MTGQDFDFIEPIKEFCRSHEADIDEVKLDGAFCQVKTDNFKGWYIGNQVATKDGSPYVVFLLADWRTGEKYTYKFSPKALSKADQKLADKQIEIIKETARLERIKIEREVAEVAQKEFNDFVTETSNPYLNKKGLKGIHGAKSVRNSFGLLDLVIPMKDETGRVWGYQKIDESGQKQYKFNQRTIGLYFHLGELNPKSEQVFFCEGFATAISIREATNKPVICCFTSSNLVAVAKTLRKILGSNPSFIFCADDDRFNNVNAGVEGAKKAAKESRGSLVIPEFSEINKHNKTLTDFNDLHVSEGIDKVREQLSKKFLPTNEIIETEHTGFRKLEWKRGVETKLPDYDGLMKFFQRKHSFIVHSNSECVYTFNGKMYVECSPVYIRSFAEEHYNPKPTGYEAEEFLRKLRRNNIVDNDFFETSVKDKINFNNGVLDVKTGQLLGHSRNYGFLFCLPYDYDPKAKAPRFEKMLSDVTENDDTVKQILLEYAGYCLSGDRYWIHKALILEGRGRNGKSTFIDSLRAVLGQDNTSSLSMSDLNSETKRYELHGKIANLSEEQPNVKMVDSSNFKSATSGGLLSGRALYQRQIEFQNKAKFIFSLNELPETSDKSEAFFKRFIIVPFRKIFSEKDEDFDPNIKEKLERECAGIFNICFNSYQETKKRGYFDIPQSLIDEIRDYSEFSDPIQVFLDDNLQVYPMGNGHDHEYAQFSDIYERYCDYCDETNNFKLSRDKFSKVLKQKIPHYNKRKRLSYVDKKRTRVIYGTTLI